MPLGPHRWLFDLCSDKLRTRISIRIFRPILKCASTNFYTNYPNDQPHRDSIKDTRIETPCQPPVVIGVHFEKSIAIWIESWEKIDLVTILHLNNSETHFICSLQHLIDFWLGKHFLSKFVNSAPIKLAIKKKKLVLSEVTKKIKYQPNKLTRNTLQKTLTQMGPNSRNGR